MRTRETERHDKLIFVIRNFAKAPKNGVFEIKNANALYRTLFRYFLPNTSTFYAEYKIQGFSLTVRGL